MRYTLYVIRHALSKPLQIYKTTRMSCLPHSLYLAHVTWRRRTHAGPKPIEVVYLKIINAERVESYLSTLHYYSSSSPLCCSRSN